MTPPPRIAVPPPIGSGMILLAGPIGAVGMGCFSTAGTHAGTDLAIVERPLLSAPEGYCIRRNWPVLGFSSPAYSSSRPHEIRHALMWVQMFAQTDSATGSALPTGALPRWWPAVLIPKTITLARAG